MQKSKKALALVIMATLVLLLFAALPAPTYAAGQVYLTNTPSGADEYDSLADAVSAINTAGGGTITLATDVTEALAAAVPFLSAVTIDLNGFNYTNTSGAMYIIIDGASGGSLTTTGAGSFNPGGVGVNGGSLTMTGDIIADAGGAIIARDSAVVVINGNVSADHVMGLDTYGVKAESGTDVTINGNVTVTKSVMASGGVPIAGIEADDARVAVNGNIVVNQTVAAPTDTIVIDGVAALNGAEVTVSGNIELTSSDASQQMSFLTGVYADNGSNVSVSGDIIGSAQWGIAANGAGRVAANNITLSKPGNCIAVQATDTAEVTVGHISVLANPSPGSPDPISGVGMGLNNSTVNAKTVTVSGSDYAVGVGAGQGFSGDASTANVQSVQVSAPMAMGVIAITSSNETAAVNVSGNITATGAEAIGVTVARPGAKVDVKGSVSASIMGVGSGYGAEVIVGGDVTVTAAGSIGIWAGDVWALMMGTFPPTPTGGVVAKVTVNGSLNADPASIGVSLSDNSLVTLNGSYNTAGVYAGFADEAETKTASLTKSGGYTGTGVNAGYTIYESPSVAANALLRVKTTTPATATPVSAATTPQTGDGVNNMAMLALLGLAMSTLVFGVAVNRKIKKNG